MVLESPKLIPNHSKYIFKLFPKSKPNTNQILNNSTYNLSFQHTISQLTTKMISSHQNSTETYLPLPVKDSPNNS